MAKLLSNKAQITYNNNGTITSVYSNETETSLAEQYLLAASKAAHLAEVQRGDNALYTIRIENTGIGDLYSPAIFDNLGFVSGTDLPLQYISNSKKYYLNGTEINGAVSLQPSGILFQPNAVLTPGDNITITYAAKVSQSAPNTIENTATITTKKGSATGDDLTATAKASITVASAANISIFKTADKANVVSGDTLTYTLTLMNTGGAEIESIKFSDPLPSEFTIDNLSYTIAGVTTPIPATDYSVDPATNTLTIPSETSTLKIPVAAATATSPGITIITVSGTIA